MNFFIVVFRPPLIYTAIRQSRGYPQQRVVAVLTIITCLENQFYHLMALSYRNLRTAMTKKIVDFRCHTSFPVAGFLCLLLVLLMAGCAPEPSRDNPLDPVFAQGEDFDGRAFSFYEPRIPLSGVQVTLLPLGRLAFTDDNGRFILENVPTGQYQLIAGKDSYYPDTLQVTITADGPTGPVTFFLNAVPEIIRRHYVSRHIDEVFPGEFYDAVFSVVLSDADGIGDLESASFSIPTLNYEKVFQSTSRPDSFFVRILDIEFEQGSPADNLFLLTENEAVIRVTDRPGATVNAGPFSLQRIIRDLPEPQKPVLFDTTGARPRFSWKRFQLPYDFSYTLKLERNIAGAGIEVFNWENIPEDSLSFVYPDSLPNGIYQWFLGARDRLGNVCRAKKANFIISGSTALQ